MRTLRIRINIDIDPGLIGLAVTILALGQIAWAFGYSDVFLQTLWPKGLAIQVLLLALACLAFVVVARLLEQLRLVGTKLVLACSAVAVSVALYGVASILAVGLFVAASLALGIHCHVLARARTHHAITSLVCGAALLALGNMCLTPFPINTIAVHAAIMLVPLLGLAVHGPARALFLGSIGALVVHIRQPLEARLATVLLTAWAFTLTLWFLVLGALPELYHDGLAVHLYMASYMQAHGRWSFDPNLYVFAYMPAAITHLFAHFFILAGEHGARLFNVALLFGTSAGIVLVARTCATKNAALAAALLFASTPVSYIETISLFVENGLAIWIIGAVYILLRNWDEAENDAVALLAVLAAACATKLHGAMASVVIGLVFLWRVRATGGVGAVLRLVPALAACGALGLAPYAYSYLNTGNPVFPFYNDIFGSAYFPKVRFADTRWLSSMWPNPAYVLSIRSSAFLESWNGAGGFTWMVFLPAALIMPFLTRRRGPVVCAVLGLVLSAVMLSQIRYLRYVQPFLPLLCVPIAHVLSVMGGGWRRHAVTAMVALVAVLNAYKVPSAGWVLREVDFRAVIDPGAAERMERTYVPQRIANKEINRLAGKDARVLYVGGPFGALLQGTAIYSNWYVADFRRDGAAVTDRATAEAYLDRLKVDYVVHDGSVSTPFGAALMSAASAGRQPALTVGPLTLWKLR